MSCPDLLVCAAMQSARYDRKPAERFVPILLTQKCTSYMCNGSERCTLNSYHTCVFVHHHHELQMSVSFDMSAR